LSFSIPNVYNLPAGSIARNYSVQVDFVDSEKNRTRTVAVEVQVPISTVTIVQTPLGPIKDDGSKIKTKNQFLVFIFFNSSNF
jgi:hypothetical protein